jgi:superfamily II DNA or RNA helicase
MDELFETIREAAGRDVWSRGVELVRQDAVTGDRSSEDEIVLRVFERSRGVATIITLFPNDQDWNRDCGCKVDPCHHVAAAIIALRRAQEQGSPLPHSQVASGQLQYAFRREQGALAFERYIVSGTQRELLNVPLSSLSTGRFSHIAVSPSKVDMAIEIALGNERRGRLKPATMMKVLPLLADVPLTLDDRPCSVVKEALGISVQIRDEGLGIHVIGKRDARIRETFSNGAVLSEAGLHPQAELQLEAEDRDILLHGKSYSLREIERFASEKLPHWQQRYRIEKQGQNLPEFVRAEPELELHWERKGDGLIVAANIIYGQPPIARIVEGVFRPVGQKVPVRDHDAEKRLKDQLWRQWGIELYHSRYFPTDEAIPMARQLAAWSGPSRGDGLEQFRIYGSMEPDLQWQNGRIDMHWLVSDAQEPKKASGGAVLRAWEQGQKLVPLLDGGFAPLPLDWLARYGEKVRELLSAQEGREELPRAAHPQALELFESLDREAPADLKAFARLKSFAWTDTDAKLPSDFTAQLRPYQKQGVAWLQHMQALGLGALLADDMGLGKTVQSIAVLPTGSLIIAPTSVLPNWRKELQRFRPHLKVALYHGSQRRWDTQADVVLTSYGLLRQDQDRLIARTWNMVVLDEAQMIKNPESKVAQAAQQIPAAFRLALSGTPVENRLDDLWSLFAFINPGLLGGRKDFRERWSRPIEDGQEAVAHRLRQLLKPFILRRLKTEVAPDLPPRIEKQLHAELWPEERQLYDAILAATRQDVLDRLSAGGSVFEALEALLRLRQACCHPGLIPGQSATQSSKLTLLLESLETALAEGHKALVFSQWTSLLDRLEPLLVAAGVRYLRLDGSTTDRQAIVDGFQAEDGPPVLIMSLKAGGVGLNLTRADHVFILDPWWNPAAADQAADRAHRIGQERTVMIHPLVALDSIEERIMELQNQKRALAAAALGEGAALPTITREDILYLLSEA